MKPYLKTVHSTTSTVVDKETGEVLDVVTEKTKVVIQDKASFFFFYLNTLDDFNTITPVAFKIFCWIAGNAAFDTNKIILNLHTKTLCAKATDVAINTVHNTIPKLVSAGFLIKMPGARSATYTINPSYTWQGNIVARKQVIKMLLELECTFRIG